MGFHKVPVAKVFRMDVDVDRDEYKPGCFGYIDVYRGIYYPVIWGS